MTGEADLLAREPAYRLDDQIGFVLRQVQQRHALIFAAAFGDDLTPMQWAVLAKLAEVGECSQNQLGRLVSMDAATIKGVVDRLIRRGMTETRADPDDRRRVVLKLTAAGCDTFEAGARRAARVTDETLEPLTAREGEQLVALLRRLR